MPVDFSPRLTNPAFLGGGVTGSGGVDHALDLIDVRDGEAPDLGVLAD